MFKLKLIIPALLALGVGAYYIQILGSENALFERFPDFDPKLVVKVHREFVKDTLAGKHNGTDLTDEVCDKIFLQMLSKYTK